MRSFFFKSFISCPESVLVSSSSLPATEEALKSDCGHCIVHGDFLIMLFLCILLVVPIRITCNSFIHIIPYQSIRFVSFRWQCIDLCVNFVVKRGLV